MVRAQPKRYRYHSTSRMVIGSFIILNIILVVGIGYPAFSNWHSSIEKTTGELSENLNQETIKQIDSFIEAPLHINDVNYKMIENGIIDLRDEAQREKFFVSILSSYTKNIFSYGYCTVDGDYYGAVNDMDGTIEIVKNDADTGGKTWYYAVNNDMSAGSFLKSTGKDDPRTSVWYETAMNAGAPVFSPAYKSPFQNEMAIAAVYPVYGSYGTLEGVLTASLLLPDISENLAGIVDGHGGSVAIVEKGSGYLIANSSGADNYTISEDGTLERKYLGNLNNSALLDAYQQYRGSGTAELSVGDLKNKLFVKIQEYKQDGLNWEILSAVPESPMAIELSRNIWAAVVFSCAMFVLAIAVYYMISQRLLKPLKKLLIVSEEFSSGDLNQRAPIVRNDEIGRISEIFNRIADAMQQLANNLEATVVQRTEELQKANETLDEQRSQLRLTLDNTVEGILGVDLKMICTFCNASCLRLLGYSRPEDLVGKKLLWLIYHSSKDGRSKREDTLSEYLFHGEAGHAVEDVLWRSDGTCFDMEYRALPQYKNGQHIGYVVTFTDITDRKREEEKIKFLSCHDSMTGLYNRGFFELKMQELDTEENLPVSFIYIDLNGLKMMNDTFGHASGDKLILKVAEVLKENCRKGDIAARVGGDEFCVLLPQTKLDEARRLAGKLKEEFSRFKINSVSCSMAFGIAVKRKPYQRIEKVMEAAETEMYREKSVSRKSFGLEALKSILNTLYEKRPCEKRHSEEVGRLCGEMGAAMGLPESEIKMLENAGYLHDIGKIALSDEILGKGSNAPLTESEAYMFRQHPATGYRLLNLSEETLALANGVYGHHERWDGSGYPKGLKGAEIPLISRIICVAEAYERIRNRANYREESRAEALLAIQGGAGTLFDPQIAESFLRMMADISGENF